MKIKVFIVKPDKLQATISEWLTESGAAEPKGIKIEHVTLTSIAYNLGTADVVCVILYRAVSAGERLS